MSNETNGGTNVPATRKVNPFALYADLYGGENFFEGDFVKLSQEDGWVRGSEKEQIGETEMFCANLLEARHGWIKYNQGERPQRLTVRVADNPQGIPRESCGDMDPRLWNKDRDPWVSTIYLPMRCLTDDSIVCFTGGGQGASKAVGELCKVYARPGADRGGKMPVILLEDFTFENRSGGTTRWPRFKIVDWQFWEADTPAPPVELVEISATEAPKPAAIESPKARYSDMDDSIPF
jgi:hypothetical protein